MGPPGGSGRGRSRLAEGVEKLKQQSSGKFDIEEYLPPPLRSSAEGVSVVLAVTPKPAEILPVVPKDSTNLAKRGTLKMPSFFRALSFHPTPPPSDQGINEMVTPGTAKEGSGGSEGSEKSDVNALRESTGSTDTSPFSLVSNTLGSKNEESSPGGSGGSEKKTSGSVGKAKGLRLDKNDVEGDVEASGGFALGTLT